MESQVRPLLDATGLILQWLQIIQRLHLCKHICITEAYIQRLCQKKTTQKTVPISVSYHQEMPKQHLQLCMQTHLHNHIYQYSARLCYPLLLNFHSLALFVCQSGNFHSSMSLHLSPFSFQRTLVT